MKEILKELFEYGSLFNQKKFVVFMDIIDKENHEKIFFMAASLPKRTLQINTND